MFSLQALAGVAFTDTMQIVVGLGAASLVALLDSGSTHNFISEAAAHRSGLPIHRRACLTAMVANGERVKCLGVIRGALLRIDAQGLPPPRSRDHAITLVPGSPPVAVRPYRYPALHKDELERQCAAMLAQGIIRRSSSAFSSPVLLV